MPHLLEGLVAATFTPLKADRSLDLDRIPALAARLAEDGLSGAFVGGTTGEFPSLTIEEREALAERWAACLPQGLKLIVHVGGTALGDARRLAQQAWRLGAHAISLIGPYFFRPSSVAMLVEYCAEVVAAAGELPLYYYHIPGMTRVELPMGEFLAAAAARIPNLAGLKFSHDDFMDLGRCLAIDHGRLNVLFGYDEMLLPALALGAHGAVGTTYGFAAPLYHRLIRAFRSGDLAAARAAQQTSIAMIQAFQRAGGQAGMKLAMDWIGLSCGPVRLPQRQPSAAEAAALRRELETLGFFEWCSGRGR